MRFKAHPTTYGGVNFRSRLEARWAAFFDLCGWVWAYEPFELEGWTPDFKIDTPDFFGFGPSLVEVKPIDWTVGAKIEVVFERPDLKKAWAHVSYRTPILILGLGPWLYDRGVTVGVWLEERSEGVLDRMELSYGGFDANETALLHWREAGNRTQWRGR